MTTAGMRIYRGLNRKERPGWIVGLTPLQAVVCVLAVAPVLLAMSTGRWSQALLWAVVAGVVVAAVVVPVLGRPAVVWLADLVAFQVGVAMGWSKWQSRAAAGLPTAPDEPDLPGVLARLQFLDGPVFLDHGRVCLIHDSADGRWGATARLTHCGVGMLSAPECDQLASRLGSWLVSLSHRDAVDRVSLLVRTVPDDGTEYRLWCAHNTDPHAPDLARVATQQLDAVIGSISVRTELFVTVSGPESALRRPAQAAGGGTDGRAFALYRALDGLEDDLKSLGVQSVSWLSGTALAEALRTGFHPASAPSLTAEQLTRARTGADPGGGLPLAAAGPTTAPSPAARAYHHDGYSTVAYSVLMPEATVFGSLGPLLAVRTAGERRSLAIHYEVLSPRAAARAVQTDRFRSNVITDWKRQKGFTTAGDERQASGALAQERAVAAGHAMVRFTAVTAVTVPTDWNIEDHATRLENDASRRFRLLRLEMAQDSAFVAAALPVGIGLPRLRGALS